MHERDLEAEQALARRLVDEIGTRVRELRERRTHVAHLVRNMVHPGPALREEAANRRVLAGRLEEFDTAGPDPQRRRADPLAVHGRPVLDLGAEQPRIRGERLVQVVNGNAKVMDSLRLHAGEATAPAEPPDLPSDQSRSVSQAQPAYAQADSCDAATLSLAAPHG
jgi:hypothetical protein